jgi:hypothetical protein
MGDDNNYVYCALRSHASSGLTAHVSTRSSSLVPRVLAPFEHPDLLS